MRNSVGYSETASEFSNEGAEGREPLRRDAGVTHVIGSGSLLSCNTLPGVNGSEFFMEIGRLGEDAGNDVRNARRQHPADCGDVKLHGGIHGCQRIRTEVVLSVGAAQQLHRLHHIIGPAQSAPSISALDPVCGVPRATPGVDYCNC